MSPEVIIEADLVGPSDGKKEHQAVVKGGQLYSKEDQKHKDIQKAIRRQKRRALAHRLRVNKGLVAILFGEEPLLGSNEGNDWED